MIFKRVFFDRENEDINGTFFFNAGIKVIAQGFPGGTSGKEPRDLRDAGLIPGLGRSPGGGHGNPLHYSCLENSMNRGALWAMVHVVAKSQT